LVRGRELIEVFVHFYPPELLIGKIEDGFPVFRGELVSAGAEMDAQMVWHPQQIVNGLGGQKISIGLDKGRRAL